MRDVIACYALVIALLGWMVVTEVKHSSPHANFDRHLAELQTNLGKLEGETAPPSATLSELPTGIVSARFYGAQQSAAALFTLTSADGGVFHLSVTDSRLTWLSLRDLSMLAKAPEGGSVEVTPWPESWEEQNFSVTYDARRAIQAHLLRQVAQAKPLPDTLLKLTAGMEVHPTQAYYVKEQDVVALLDSEGRIYGVALADPRLSDTTIVVLQMLLERTQEGRESGGSVRVPPDGSAIYAGS